MKTHFKPDELPVINYPVVTMGTFDGVHAGHRSIFEKLVQIAESKNGETVVVTFEPHPRLVLHLDEKKLRFLNTLEEKIELLENCNIDHLVLLEFTREFSNITSEEYIRSILVNKINTKSLVIGYDHHFGKNRSGDFKNLLKMGDKYGFTVDKIAVKEKNKIAVSSTKIRDALLAGDIELANTMLGYQYSLKGKVVGGKKIGAALGFPTANISVENKQKLIPAHGVYAVYVKYNDRLLKGMLSIGSKPTFNEFSESMEVHIFDFDETIYDENVTVCFSQRIRDIIRFENTDALRDQLFNDMLISKELLL